VIWRFMYAYEAPGTPQTGFLNGVLAALGIDPVPWLTIDTLAFNTILLIVVMTWMWTGFAMVILSAALKGISPELLEAARVDGAGEIRVFATVVLPLLKPIIATLAVFSFLGAWNDFMWPLIVLTDSSLQTLPVALAGLSREHVQDNELMMAGSVITVLPVLLLFLALQRQYMEGLLAGSVKG